MKILIAQGGGPTAVINQSLVGAILEAKKQDHEIIGSKFGISGILTENFVDLNKLDEQTLETLANTPASALGSTRDKPDTEYCKKILKVMKKNKINAFLYIGGNDSSETIRIVTDHAKKDGYPLKGFHIPKTVDNDLMENDHTPGWPSAARFVAKATMGIDRDNASLPGIHLVVIMGRHAGFLTCAASLGKFLISSPLTLVHRSRGVSGRAGEGGRRQSSRMTGEDVATSLATEGSRGPHLTYIPEHPFNLEAFATDVQTAIEKHGRCVVALSEGIQDENGTPVVQHFSKSEEKDAHGNIQLSSLPLGDALANYIKEKTDIKRVRQDTFGYTQRSYPDPSPIDQKEARLCGELAVKLCANSPAPDKERWLVKEVDVARQTGSVVVLKDKLSVVDLEKVANKTRHLPEEYYDYETKQVTQAFFDYALPLIGNLSSTMSL